MPFDSGSLAWQKSGAEPVVRREPDVVRGRHHHVRDDPGLQTTHPVGEHRSSGHRRGPRSTRPRVRASWSARSLSANRTNRTRDHASTAQNTCTPSSTPQSMTNVSPGVHTAGRRPRWLPLRHKAFCVANQAPEVAGRPLIAGGACRREQPLGRDPALAGLDLLRDHIHDIVEAYRPRSLRPGTTPPTLPAWCCSTIRRTVLCVDAADRCRTPEATHLSIGGQYVQIRSLAFFTRGPPRG